MLACWSEGAKRWRVVERGGVRAGSQDGGRAGGGQEGSGSEIKGGGIGEAWCEAVVGGVRWASKEELYLG